MQLVSQRSSHSYLSSDTTLSVSFIFVMFTILADKSHRLPALPCLTEYNVHHSRVPIYLGKTTGVNNSLSII